MNFSEAKELVNFIDKSNFLYFDIEMDNVKMKMSKRQFDSLQSSNVEHSPVVVETTEKVKQIVDVDTDTVDEEMEKCSDDEIDFSSGEPVKSPIVGTFYRSPGPNKEFFVKKGDSVKKGDVLCIVEAMKIMNEIVSPFDGVVIEILPENETLVEYGQTLFLIK